MWKAKVFLSDYADMCYRHLDLSRVFSRLNMLPVSLFQTFLYPEPDDGRSSNKSGPGRVEDGTFQKCTVNK